MTTLVVPGQDGEPWPTLGPQLEPLLREGCIFGPGSLQGKPAELDAEKRAVLYSLYEVYPKGHRLAGRRRFKRGGVSWRKGLAKTEFGAWVTWLELHPDAPVRCDGFDAYGQPVGRPVVSPYIPMLAVTVEQVEELAYGALYYMVTEGPDADLFDATNERIVRLSARGTADGKAVPLANSPGSRDGARTTFQLFDEPHRLHLPRQVDAHETMVANLEKRVLEDPWGLYVGTAGELGQGSIAEGLHEEAQAIEKGTITDPRLFYIHREASPGYDLKDQEQRVKAVIEATGPAGEYGPGQFESIARQWERPRADLAYLERVWLNRWVKAARQAFDIRRWNDELRRPATIRPGSFVTWGFDGARYRDSTAIVLTDIATGLQEPWALWERPLEAETWETPESEVLDAFERLHATHKVFRGYYDPFYWTETMRTVAGRFGDDVVVEWRTNRTTPMAWAVRRYIEGQRSAAVTWAAVHDLSGRFAEHIAAAGRAPVNVWDDQGEQLCILEKIHPDRKFDMAMAGCLSWEARLDALKLGAKPPEDDLPPLVFSL